MNIAGQLKTYSPSQDGHTTNSSESVNFAPVPQQLQVQNWGDPTTAEAVHDIRNILNTISLLADLALLNLEVKSPTMVSVRQIKAACLDASDLCNRIMDDSYKGSAKVEGVDMSTLVIALAPQLETYVPAASSLRFDLAASTPLPDVSPGEIRQVVMNLVKNAAEALGDRQGSVTVSTGLVKLDATSEDVAACRTSITPGKYSFIAVSDTGCGMDDATRAHLFESSFTTKGDGHGLGMISIWRIVQGYGGVIQVHSQIGDGTQIRVLFPLDDRADPKRLTQLNTK